MSQTERIRVRRWPAGESAEEWDEVAVEQPLEIRLHYYWKDKPLHRTLAVAMRTPGQDEDLVRGLLLGEGIITSLEDITAIHATGNTIDIDLSKDLDIDWPTLERNLVMNSACGACGRASIEGLTACEPPTLTNFRTTQAIIRSLPQLLSEAQQSFESTGGLHAAALFTAAGQLLALREDVGRHNALDKLIGAALAANTVLTETIACVSSRASFDLVQKVAAARIPILTVIGAPTSLAIQTAESAGITLVAFLRSHRFNTYSAPWRIEA